MGKTYRRTSVLELKIDDKRHLRFATKCHPRTGLSHLFHTSWQCAFKCKGTQRDVIPRPIRDRISPKVRWKKLSTWPPRDTPTNGHSLRVIAYGSCTRCPWGWAFPFNALTSIPIWSHAKKEVPTRFFIIFRSECLRGGFAAVIINECVNPFNPSRSELNIVSLCFPGFARNPIHWSSDSGCTTCIPIMG